MTPCGWRSILGKLPDLNAYEMSKSEFNSNTKPFSFSSFSKQCSKAIFGKMQGMALNHIWSAIFGGGSSSGPTFDDVLKSLDEVKAQIDELGQALIRRFAESDFKVAHGRTIDSVDLVEGLGRLIANQISQNNTDGCKSSYLLWGKDNWNAARSTRAFLNDPRSGAIPSLLNLYSIWYPTTGLSEVRSDIVNYVEGARATFGIALLNQAWLQEKCPELKGEYESDMKFIASKAMEQAYNLIGATYPVPAGKPFLHRVGTGKALVDSTNRQLIRGEPGKAKTTQSRTEVNGLLGLLAAANTNAWKNLTISAYMEQMGFNSFLPAQKSYNDPASVKHFQNCGGTFCYWDYQNVDFTKLFMSGNKYQGSTHRAWRSEGCGSYKCRVKTIKQAKEKLSYYQNKLAREEHMYYREDVEENTYGLPALMNKKIIELERDGIQVHNQTETPGADGNSIITLSITGLGDSPFGFPCGVGSCGYRGVDPKTGQEVIPFFTKQTAPGQYWPLPDTRAIVLEAGYRTHIPGEFVVRQNMLVDRMDKETRKIGLVLEY